MTEKKSVVTAAVVLGLASLNGATLMLNDGSRLEGELVKIHEGTVHFKTGFAGELKIAQSQVVSLESDKAVNLRTQTGEVFQGPVEATEGGTLVVASRGGTVTTALSSVVSGWDAGSRDPVVVAEERKWSFMAGVDVTGSDGNTENFGTVLSFGAKLEGPEDRLDLYGSYRYKETEGLRTEDEQKGGIRYTSFFTDKWGWFVREELERDTFEGIDFRSTSAAGATYRFIEQERLDLEGSAGLSYRYESYSDPAQDSDGFPGLDFGLNLDWQFADWGRLVSNLNYIPSVDDFADYLIEHESGVNIPLDSSDFWVLRFGIGHNYNSSPSGGREKLDTTYFIRLLLSWE